MTGRRKRQSAAEDRAGGERILASRYRLGAVIGRGGMGVVHEAQQLDRDRTVAIKLLLPRDASRHDVVARFEREASLASAIGHDGIVRVLEVGRTGDGQCFIVMERLLGSSLSELLRAVPPPRMSRLVPLLEQVLTALEAAHDKGIVHRDIKPENIFVTPPAARGRAGAGCPEDGRERAKVLDFGIAKLAGAVRLTGEGDLIGTPLFMSPEQILGDGEVGPRADLYSVGVILYHALSGRFPYEASSTESLIAAVRSSDPRPLEHVAAGLSPVWGAVLDRAITRRPEERIPSARALRDALQALPRELLEATAACRVAADAPTRELRRPAGTARSPSKNEACRR